MIFAKRVFLAAGIYGLVVLVPMVFMEQMIGATSPPAITHPEYFYGFLGVAIAWQVVFLMISRDPERYRALLPAMVIEKASLGFAAVVLFAMHRIAAQTFVAGLIDLMWLSLFVAAYKKLKA